MSVKYSVMKGFPKIVVATDIKKMSALKLCAQAKGVKTTGDPDVVNPPATDATLQQQADAVLALLELRVTHRSKALTLQTETALEKLKESYFNVGRYVYTIANKVARAAGNVEAGEAVVHRCGFKLKKKRALPPRIFEVVASGVGWTHLRTKAAGKYAAYIWRYGITHEKGVIPTEFMPIAVNMVCELILTHSFSGKIVACQVACVLPKPRSAKTNKAQSKQAKNALEAASFKGNKPAVEFGMDALQWSDFIYFSCR